MVANSDRVVALCDSTKFGLDYLVSFATIQDISAVVTDEDAPQPYVSELRNLGIDVSFGS